MLEKVKYNSSKNFFNNDSEGTFNEKYKFPLSLFLVFENNPVSVWSTDLDTKFDYYTYLNSSNLHKYFLYIKKHVFSSLSSILDITFVNMPNFLMLKDKFSSKSIMGVWTLYLYHPRIRLNIVTALSTKDSDLRSVDSLYNNANWLERESCEMYGVNLFSKGDARRLLLNYFDLNAPLNKDTVSSNNYSVYYDFIDRQLQYTDGVRSEL